MEHYRFFNSTEGDIREYQASEFAEYFSRFLTDGLYTENGQAGLKVNTNSGLSISVGTGYAFVRGHMYNNDMALTKTLDASDSMLDRIDRVILRFDEVAREITVVVKRGVFSSTPTPPTLELTSTVKEMTLAQVRVRKGSSNIVANDITDERFTNTCGLVSSLIDIPAQEMWEVWNTSLNNIQNDYNSWKTQYNNEWVNWVNNTQEAWNDLLVARQQQVGIETFNGTTEPPNMVTGDIWFKELV